MMEEYYKGIHDQIKEPTYLEGDGQHATIKDFSDMMSSLEAAEKPVKWYFVTGVSGYYTFKLKANFKMYGVRKLPRKMKKRLFMSKRLRKAYLPEYYEELKRTRKLFNYVYGI